MTQPNGAQLNYYYNDARQLDYIENNLGERQDYDPGILHGDWEKVTFKTSGGDIRFEQSRAFDELGRVRLLTSPMGHNIVYANDSGGNVTQISQTINHHGASAQTKVIDHFL